MADALGEIQEIVMQLHSADPHKEWEIMCEVACAEKPGRMCKVSVTNVRHGVCRTGRTLNQAAELCKQALLHLVRSMMGEAEEEMKPRRHEVGVMRALLELHSNEETDNGNEED